MTWQPGHACIEQGVRALRHEETVDSTALYEAYPDLLFQTALTHVSRSEGAQDVIHDMFAAYLAKRSTLQDTSHRRAWMPRVTVSKCRDLQRRNAVRRYTPLENAEHIASPEDSEAPELPAVVRSLPDKLHEVAVLHYLEGFSVEETARCLRISTSAVKMRLAHGRQVIKILLGTKE